MTDTELAWATGYIEADGHIGFHIYRVGTYVETYRPIVAAYSTDLEPLVKLSQMFGGKVSVQRKRGNKNDRLGNKTLYRWVIENLKSVEVLKLIRPYLILNRRIRSADKIINFYGQREFKRCKKWTDNMREEARVIYSDLKVQHQDKCLDRN